MPEASVETTDPVPVIPIDAELSLTPARWGDRAAHLRHLNASPQISEFLWSIPYPYTERDADEWLREVMARPFSNGAEANWTIRFPSGELAGECWLLQIRRGVRAEIGYWVAPEFWSRSIASRAVRALSLFAFRELDCRKMMATVRDDNPASGRVLEKAGYTFEATLREHTVHRQQAHDVHCYGLWRNLELPDEFAETHRPFPPSGTSLSLPFGGESSEKGSCEGKKQ